MRATLAVVTLATLVTAGAAPGRAGAAPTPTLSSTIEHACDAPAAPHRMRCMALRRVDRTEAGSIAPHATPSGYGPDDLRDAYALPASKSTATVAIVDAYDDPKAEDDLAAYRRQFDLPACTTANGCFRKVNQNGNASPLPARSTAWSGEISLDLDMVSAVCPTCHILLVEAASNADDDLFAAVNRAVRMGAKFVSNSWGGDEASSQTSADTQTFDHPGVVITASTGDDGYGVQYPAASRFVTAVGGTSLHRASDSRGWSETVWSGAGSGCSRFDARPSWQPATSACGKRATADVSAVADPNTGVAVYQTYGGSGWAVYGGTSVAAPIIAAVYALGGLPGADDYPASYPYQHAGALNDVTSGRNGSCATLLCKATDGWDGPTGLGTPHGVAAFTGAPTCPTGNLLSNGGFEGGPSVAWDAPAGVIAQGGSPHLGAWSAGLDGTGHTHRDVLGQAVTVPAACTSATLSLWLRIDTAETTTTTAFDTLRVQAGTTTLATRSNLDHGGYTKITINLSAYAGRTVTLSFTGREDGSLATVFTLDDISVTAGGTDPARRTS